MYLLRKINNDQNSAQKTTNLKNCIEDTVITIIDSDSDDAEQKNVVNYRNLSLTFSINFTCKKNNKKIFSVNPHLYLKFEG